MNRNPSHEAAFLNAAGNRDFTVAVMDRLHTCQRVYGDSWSERSLHELLNEAAEEAIDIAAWSALAAQLDTTTLSQTAADRICACLDEMVHLAAKAWLITTTAQNIVHRHATPDTAVPA